MAHIMAQPIVPPITGPTLSPGTINNMITMAHMPTVSILASLWLPARPGLTPLGFMNDRMRRGLPKYFKFLLESCYQLGIIQEGRIFPVVVFRVVCPIVGAEKHFLPVIDCKLVMHNPWIGQIKP